MHNTPPKRARLTKWLGYSLLGFLGLGAVGTIAQIVTETPVDTVTPGITPTTQSSPFVPSPPPSPVASPVSTPSPAPVSVPPKPKATPAITAIPTPQPAIASNCDPSYPDMCIPVGAPDLDCGDVSEKNFTVVGNDPHRFDRDKDGIGCES